MLPFEDVAARALARTISKDPGIKLSPLSEGDLHKEDGGWNSSSGLGDGRGRIIEKSRWTSRFAPRVVPPERTSRNCDWTERESSGRVFEMASLSIPSGCDPSPQKARLLRRVIAPMPSPNRTAVMRPVRVGMDATAFKVPSFHRSYGRCRRRPSGSPREWQHWIPKLHPLACIIYPRVECMRGQVRCQRLFCISQVGEEGTDRADEDSIGRPRGPTGSSNCESPNTRGRIPGATIRLPISAPEIVNELGSAIFHRTTCRDLAKSIHCDPSYGGCSAHRVALALALKDVRGMSAACCPVGRAMGGMGSDAASGSSEAERSEPAQESNARVGSERCRSRTDALSRAR